MPQTIHITQGEYAIGSEPDLVISTLLGSCVACCLWDPVLHIGGMNHILLAISHGTGAGSTLSGINAMEVLINDLVKLGAERRRLQAKLFGGAQMISGFSEIGVTNASFALHFLEQEGIPVLSQSLGGQYARNVRFWPSTGRAMQKVTDTAVEETAVVDPSGNGLELF